MSPWLPPAVADAHRAIDALALQVGELERRLALTEGTLLELLTLIAAKFVQRL